MEELIKVHKIRLIGLEAMAVSGVAPGIMDSIEYQQLLGRIDELKRVIAIVTQRILWTTLPKSLNMNDLPHDAEVAQECSTTTLL